MDPINWTHPQVVGAIITAVFALLGVIAVALINKAKSKSEKGKPSLNQKATLSKDVQQIQATGDITIHAATTKRK